MAHRANHKSKPIETVGSQGALASIPVAEAFSFLQETKGLSSWTVRDMAKSLKISLADAKQVVSILELQGYVRAHGTTEIVTTVAGEGVQALNVDLSAALNTLNPKCWYEHHNRLEILPLQREGLQTRGMNYPRQFVCVVGATKIGKTLWPASRFSTGARSSRKH